MVIITDSNNKIVHILRNRGNTFVKPNFHVYHDKQITKEQVEKGDFKIGEAYIPRENDYETFWKEQ